MTQCFGQDSTFKKEVQELKDFMRKPNVHFLYSTAKLQGSRGLRSVSPGYDDMRLRASYDNINLKNHLPFADKSVRDILS